MSITEQLAAYGYALTEAQQIVSPRAKLTGVFVSQKKGRTYVRRADKSLIWSGPDISDFLKSYWFATPTTQQETRS